MIKTFRGKMTPGDTETIRLGTNNGLTGYKIKKFDVIQTTPGVGDVELVFQVYTVKPAAALATIDFTNPTLLAINCFRQDPNNNSTADQTVIFDDKKFNQDIFITLADAMGSAVDGNYYLELEVFSLDLNEATVATLKDMRGRE